MERTRLVLENELTNSGGGLFLGSFLSCLSHSNQGIFLLVATSIITDMQEKERRIPILFGPWDGKLNTKLVCL